MWSAFWSASALRIIPAHLSLSLGTLEGILAVKREESFTAFHKSAMKASLTLPLPGGTFKDVSNTLQNFTFMGAMVSEIAGGPTDPTWYKVWVPKGLVLKGRVNAHAVNSILARQKACVCRFD